LCAWPWRTYATATWLKKSSRRLGSPSSRDRPLRGSIQPAHVDLQDRHLPGEDTGRAGASDGADVQPRPWARRTRRRSRSVPGTRRALGRTLGRSPVELGPRCLVALAGTGNTAGHRSDPRPATRRATLGHDPSRCPGLVIGRGLRGPGAQPRQPARAAPSSALTGALCPGALLRPGKPAVTNHAVRRLFQESNPTLRE